MLTNGGVGQGGVYVFYRNTGMARKQAGRWPRPGVLDQIYQSRPAMLVTKITPSCENLI